MGEPAPAGMSRAYLRAITASLPLTQSAPILTQPKRDKVRGLGRWAVPSSDAIENYLLHNDAINAVVFDGQFAGKPLYLDIEGPVCNEIASMLGQRPDEFIASLGAATHASLTWDKQDIFHWHSKSAADWNGAGRGEAPPFSGLLCALSIAAERMRNDGKFESHNYYQRLFDYLDITDERARQKVKFAFKATLPLWEELNRWLQDKEGELGRPTAQPVNGFRYVSYAISQALIRDAERQNLHEMFVYFSFAPGEKRTYAEMEVYIDEWIKSHKAKGNLIRLWQSDGLRERIALAVCEELQAWDGAEAAEVGTGIKTYTPTWVCDIETFPPPSKIYLSLTLPAEVALRSGRWPASRIVDQTRARLLPSVETGFTFEPEGDDNLAALMPADKLNAGALLRDTFELTNGEGSICLRKNASALMPFVKSEAGGRYKQVSRISLLQPHLILCHQGMKAKVASYLHIAARPGFKEHTPQTLKFLPADWAAFTGVEILRVLDETDAKNDFLPLIPLAETSLELQQGMRLSDEVWHRSATPEALAASSNGPLRLALITADGKQVLTEASSDDTCIQLNLRAAVKDIISGTQLAVAIYHEDKKLKQRYITLSSADRPRSLGVLNVKPLFSRVSPTWGYGLLGAEPLDEVSDGITLTGYVLAGASNAAVSSSDAIPNADEIPEFEHEDPAPRLTFESTAPESGSETCVIRGYHHWLVQSHEADQKSWEPKWVQCLACRQSYIARNRKKKAKVIQGPVRPRIAPIAPQVSQLDETKPSVDTVFDALCYLGGGKYPRFAEICGQASDDPYFVSRFISNLSALGHIDVQYENIFGSPTAWRCAPPVVIQLEDGKAILSGFRSDEMLARIDNALQDFDAKLERIDQRGAPAAYFITGEVSSILPELLAALKDSHERQIAVAPSPANIVARNAPALSVILNTLPDEYIGASEHAEAFDPATGRWQPCDSTIAPGAYRTTGSRRIYAFRGQDGQLRRGTYRLVKLAAARSKGRRIHGYDARTRQFIAALGCEPPPLLERALVACSGLLPEISKGRLLYTNVGPGVAAQVMEKLYG